MTINKIEELQRYTILIQHNCCKNNKCAKDSTVKIMKDKDGNFVKFKDAFDLISNIYLNSNKNI